MHQCHRARALLIRTNHKIAQVRLHAAGVGGKVLANVQDLHRLTVTVYHPRLVS